ncbi:MAG TPA: O-antigen ligase family protein [Solirubrobacteraceae bacterium]
MRANAVDRPAAPVAREAMKSEAPAGTSGRRAITALMLLPGALVVFTGFNAGGYFPATPAILVVVLTQILLVRVIRARHPFAGIAPVTLVAIVAAGSYALETLASALWSHAVGRALVEFDRAWLYLLVLALFGTVRASARDLRWLIGGLLVGVSVVCLAGLTSRVLPGVWHTAPNVANQRLSYPVTYWNTLGLLAALGIVLAFHLASALHEPRVVRVLAAAVTPLLAATLFFTFSRGAMVAGAAGLVVYVLATRSSGLVSGAVATLPGTAALVAVAYHANLLDTVEPTTPGAVAQGHRVALAAGICAAGCAGVRLLLAVAVDPRLGRRSGRARLGRTARRTMLAGATAAAVAAILALGVPATVAHDWSRFISGAAPSTSHGDLRARLTDPSNDGRTDLWRVAMNGFSASPLHGYGAAMYQTLWDRHRPAFVYTVNAHSLYLQTMAELGIVGLALVLVVVAVVLVGLAARARGTRRLIYGALLAAAVVWALRAGVDWDWEMPVVTLGFFAAAGAALSPRAGRGPGWRPPAAARAVLVALGLLTLVVPVLIIGSQRRLDDAERALYGSGCTRAVAAARASSRWLDMRPEPYEIVGFCALEGGHDGQAVAAMEKAVSRDPGSWETHYALALAQASAGVDPRRAAEEALRMNPFEPLTRQAAKVLRTSSRGAWIGRASALRAAALASNDLSTVPS